MKLNGRATLLGTMLFLALSGFAPDGQARGCTMHEAAGQYGFTLTGIVITAAGAVPAAAVGHATVDSSGNVTGTEARNVGGGYADETLSGTLSVNSDCSGSITLNFYDGGQLVRTSVLSIVFDDQQREIRMVQKSLTLPNGAVLPVVISVEARKMFMED
jgi:hypothetical protein